MFKYVDYNDKYSRRKYKWYTYGTLSYWYT